MRKSVWLIIYFILSATACAPTGGPAATRQPATAVSLTTSTPLPLPTNTATVTPEPTETAVPQPTDTPSPAPTETAAPTATAAITIPRFSIADRFTIYGDEAAVSRGDKQFTDPGAVVFYAGQFHMFHNSFTGWPASVDIVYSTSEDGLSWARAQEEPILTSRDVPFAGVAALASSVLVLEDDTWVLYFYTWDERTWPASSGAIGLATAPAPLGPWTVVEEPILEPGSANSWDSTAVRSPSVVQTEEGFFMFYAGYGEAESAIGQAISTDGITWTKYDDPETAEPYNDSDPVFSSSGEAMWDRVNVFQPHVQRTPDGWVMLYASATNVDRTPVHNRHGLAVSSDGLNWLRSDTPIFLPEDVHPSANDIWYAELAYALDSYFVYVELGRGSNTEVYVATLTEPLVSE